MNFISFMYFMTIFSKIGKIYKQSTVLSCPQFQGHKWLILDITRKYGKRENKGREQLIFEKGKTGFKQLSIEN